MRYLEALLDVPGFGGALACAVIATLIVCYYLTLKWILKGYEDKENDVLFAQDAVFQAVTNSE